MRRLGRRPFYQRISDGRVLCSLLFLAYAFALFSCKDKPFLQRRRAYPRFAAFPKHRYKMFDASELPYAFEIPVYAKAVKDTSIFFDIDKQNPNWINILFPNFNAIIYISYIPVKGVSIYKRKDQNGVYRDSAVSNSLQRLVATSYDLVYKHSGKASEIKDSVFHASKGVSGVFFTISGNTATKYQFFVTDSVEHYLRGVLYFDTAPNEDSLMPLNQFLSEDMKRLVRTLRWKK